MCDAVTQNVFLVGIDPILYFFQTLFYILYNMASNLSGNSLVIKSNNYAIEENSSYTNYIIPNSPSFTGTNFIILPILVNKDVRNYRIVNCSSSTLILQSRGSKKPDGSLQSFHHKKNFFSQSRVSTGYKVFRYRRFQTIE